MYIVSKKTEPLAVANTIDSLFGDVTYTISDTSDITERLFPGQFTRWTIQLEIQDAFLYDIPYRRNWKLYVIEDELLPLDEYSTFEVVEDLDKDNPLVDSKEYLEFNFQKTYASDINKS